MVKKSSSLSKMAQKKSVKELKTLAAGMLDMYAGAKSSTWFNWGVDLGKKAGTEPIFKVDIESHGISLFFIGSEKKLKAMIKKCSPKKK